MQIEDAPKKGASALNAELDPFRRAVLQVMDSKRLPNNQETTMESRSVSKCRNVRQELRPDHLVMEHLPLVKAIAAGIRRNLPAHVDLDDLVQAGALGLLDATRKYRSEERRV